FRDSSTVWLDPIDSDRSRRYKMARWYDHYMELSASADGIHWRAMGRTGPTGDRTTFFYNPFRRVWVYSIRSDFVDDRTRYRLYWETPDLFSNVQWRPTEPTLWAGADRGDPQRPEYKIFPELYNLDCVAYESLLLGLFTIRRDGFASMDSDGQRPRIQRVSPSIATATLTTRPVRFSGRYLFVNTDVDTPAGSMRVEVLDRDGRPIGPYSIDACNPVRTDSTRARVTWTSAADLGAVSGEIVRFRFHLSSARLYAVWVSASPTG